MAVHLLAVLLWACPQEKNAKEKKETHKSSQNRMQMGLDFKGLQQFLLRYISIL